MSVARSRTADAYVMRAPYEETDEVVKTKIEKAMRRNKRKQNEKEKDDLRELLQVVGLGVFVVIVIVALLSSTAEASTLLLPPLKAPTWEMCEIEGGKAACLSLEESKHYLALYIAYTAQREEIRILDAAFKLSENELHVQIEVCGGMLQHIKKSNDLFVETRKILVEDDGTPFSVFEIALSSTVAFSVGTAIGIVIGLVFFPTTDPS